jgi:hypothetical protein
MKTIFAWVIMATTLPAFAEGPGGNCIGEPLACVTDILGQPTEVQGYDSIMEYQELAAKYGKYFYETPQGNTRYSGSFSVKDDVPTTMFFNQPVVHPTQGAPFRLPCEFTAMVSTKHAHVAIVGNNCSCGRLRLTDIQKGAIPPACKGVP